MLPPPPLPPPGMETNLSLSAPVPGASCGPDPCTNIAPGVGTVPSATPVHHRLPWARLLRRVLSVDALCCPRCSNHERTVPMTVLALLTDPEVVGRILRHLGLPTMAPALASARLSGRVLGFALADDSGSGDGLPAITRFPPPAHPRGAGTNRDTAAYRTPDTLRRLP